ncbi:MAG: flagellar protein FlgN [Oceanospirillum sp.]|nr:flagellar protein FlgN [Oceanospirillum sp.]
MSEALSQTVKQHLLNSIQNMKAVKSCMENEKEALKVRDIKQIQALTVEKQKLLKLIETDISERQQLLTEQNLELDDEGMQSLIESFPEKISTSLSQGWQQLISLHNDIKEINQANGMIINKGLQQVDAMLSILQYNTEARTARTYNAKGRSIAKSSRDLGQA